MKKVTGSLLLFLLFLILFTPSLWLFYGLNRGLAHVGINVVPQIGKERLVGAKFEEVRLYRGKREVLEAQEGYFLPLLFWNRLTLHNVTLDTKGRFDAGECTLRQSLIAPTQIDVRCDGPDGMLTGAIALRKREVHLLLKPSKGADIQSLRRYFRKTKEGYRYVSDF